MWLIDQLYIELGPKPTFNTTIPKSGIFPSESDCPIKNSRKKVIQRVEGKCFAFELKLRNEDDAEKHCKGTYLCFFRKYWSIFKSSNR